jgi:hypothetical protein
VSGVSIRALDEKHNRRTVLPCTRRVRVHEHCVRIGVRALIQPQSHSMRARSQALHVPCASGRVSEWPARARVSLLGDGEDADEGAVTRSEVRRGVRKKAVANNALVPRCVLTIHRLRCSFAERCIMNMYIDTIDSLYEATA